MICVKTGNRTKRAFLAFLKKAQVYIFTAISIFDIKSFFVLIYFDAFYSNSDVDTALSAGLENLFSN